jgi:hypothetical protein
MLVAKYVKLVSRTGTQPSGILGMWGTDSGFQIECLRVQFADPVIEATLELGYVTDSKYT